MIVMNTKWRSDKGSIDFIQVVVGLMIISIAAVGTLHALYYGYEQLDQQMRHRKAVSLARSYMEYLQGRIHTDMEDDEDSFDRSFFNGNLAAPKSWHLDKRNPATTFDDIDCQMAYGPIKRRDFTTTGEGIDQYEITVYLTWWEPSDVGLTAPHEIVFFSSMVPAAQ